MKSQSVSRRQFVIGATSFAALFGSRAFAVPAGSVATDGANLRFGVLSDVHLNKPGDEDTFLAALRYFAKANVDGVLIAGDIADSGRIEQLVRCGACWNAVFPGNKGPDGRHVEKLFVYGNHDTDGWTWGADEQKRADPAYASLCITPETQASTWEKAFGEKYEPIWMKEVRGYRFIGAHWPAIKDLGAFLKAHAAELGTAKPFFYTQHPHPRGTCFGSWAWGRDDGKSTAALSAFPNAVAFSGHSHYTLTDERTIWQGAFTSINTASLRYASCDYSLYENIDGNGHGFRGENRKHLMKELETGNGRHGMVVSVLGDKLVIERRNFADGTSLGCDWVVPVPANGGYTYDGRAAKRSAPAFAADAKATVEVKDGLATVSFPAAKSVDGCRVFSYEVTATLTEDDIDLVQAQRRVMAPDFHLAETPEGRPGSCVFSLAELKARGRYVISIRPIECFGKKGAPITVGAVL